MIDQGPLERRYRRWLALYPETFRAEHEQEMVDVLMQGASPDQTRPRAAEIADLATHGLRRRADGRIPSNWERAHAKVMVPVRIAIALWLCFITAMLVGFHRGELWLIVLVPAIALHFYIAYKARFSTPRTPRS